MFDSFRFATARPVDARYVVETTDDAVNCDGTYYQGCITYITRVDTFVLHNQRDGSVIQPLNYRQKITNLLPFFKELKYRRNVGAGVYPLCQTDVDLKYLDLNDLYNKAFNDSENHIPMLYLDMEYDHISHEYNNNSNGFTIFNKYMRGYDCLLDFEHNIFITKMIKKIDFSRQVGGNRYCMFYKMGHIFDKNGGLNIRLENINARIADQESLIKSMANALLSITEVLNRVKDKVFTDATDSETIQLITSIDSHVKITIGVLSDHLTNTNYNKSYTPYENVPAEDLTIDPYPDRYTNNHRYNIEDNLLDELDPESAVDHL